MASAIAACIDGELLEPSEARISVLDDGLLRGDGVFEMVKLYGGHPFRLRAHVDRLERSAAAIELPVERRLLDSEIETFLGELPGFAELGLRIVLTRGGRHILLAEELPAWPRTARVALINLNPSEILVGVKSISYAANMQAIRITAARGADEAIYVDRDRTVLEAPTSAIFWAGADGRLRTPAVECGILDSITRAVLIERLEVEDGAFPTDDLLGTKEAFLASTTREVQPIAAVDDRELPEVDGPLTSAASEALAEAVQAERSGRVI
jgi:branched-chain amino acid aminotransferase